MTSLNEDVKWRVRWQVHRTQEQVFRDAFASQYLSRESSAVVQHVGLRFDAKLAGKMFCAGTGFVFVSPTEAIGETGNTFVSS